ncbi:MAG: MmgE/PrpD family protein [Pseudomonadota bacterium]
MTQQLDRVVRPSAAQFERIAAFALDPDLEVPEDALRHTATLLIDTIGVAAGATRLEVGRIARDFAAEFHLGRPASSAPMLFDGRVVSQPGAAWALATQIDNLDGHDGLMETKGHIGCAVVPALFALAAQIPQLTAREALRAMAMAYEVAARAGVSLHATVSDYHTSGAWNALGVAAMACRLDGATAEVMRHALGIAEYHGPRSQMMREIDNPTMLHDGSGMGALVGIKAAFLAQRGFTGAPAITVEGPDVAGFWDDLGARWTVLENYVKPYPTCRWGHPAIDAMRMVMKTYGVRHGDVAAVKIRTFDEGARLFAGMPNSTTEAQYSMHFAVATMLRYGELAPKHIEGAALSDPEVEAIIPRISVEASDSHNARFPEGRWSDIEVTLTDGRVVSSGDVPASGGPGAWRPDENVKAKFLSFCDGVLSRQRADAIWTMRDRILEADIALSDLAKLLINPGDA